MASDALKVVGASWLKTRISSMILLGAGLLAIGAFFVANMDRPQFDGTYCATAFWAKKSGFHVEYWKQRIDLENIPVGVGRICYKDSTLQNGWAQLELETQRNYPDWVQAYSAGLLEGTLTWSKIYDQWLNTISSACDRDENSQNFCVWLRDTLDANYENIKTNMNTARKHDHFWHQIHMFYYQLEGLKAGWRKGARRARFDGEIPAKDFLLMNAAADIYDLKIYFENFVLRSKENETMIERNFLTPSATMITKLIESETDGMTLLFGHSSVGSYSAMLRVWKRYKLRYHFTDQSKGSLIPGTDIMFTGYPGILASTDDFYTVRGRHLNSLVAGVGIKNDNLKLWENITLQDAIPLVARVMAANRLAQNRRTWARIMSRYPFTGNKQWALIDLKKMDMSHIHSSEDATKLKAEIAQTIPQKGFFWIVEQLPGKLQAEDMTEIFHSNSSLWSGNGVPYIAEMMEASGVNNEHNLSRRANAFNITDLDAVQRFLKLNSFRGDLQGDQSIPFGNIDLKMFGYGARIGNSDFHAIAGPIHVEYHHHHQHQQQLQQQKEASIDDTENDKESSEEVIVDESKKADIEIFSDRRLVRDDIRALALQRIQGPFKWSQTHSNVAEVKHHGQPDAWNFDKFSPNWAWHS